MQAVKLCLVLLAPVAGALLAGESTINDFTSPYSSNNLLLQDSLRLDYLDWQTTRVYGNKSPGSATSSYAPDVVTMGPDSFTFFWAEYSNELIDTVFTRSVKLGEMQTTEGNSFQVSDHGVYYLSHLHAAPSHNGYFATYVDSRMRGALIGTNGQDTIQIYPDKALSPFNSIALFDRDTFVVVHRIQTSSLSIHKVLSNENQISLLQSKESILLRSDDPQNLIINNPSVAVDSAGRVLVLVSRGNYDQEKRLDYLLLDRDFNQLDEGHITEKVTKVLGEFYYDDAPVVSHAVNRFASLYWTENGLFLDTMYIDDDDKLSHNSIQLAAGSQFRSTAIAAAGQYIFCAWKGTMTRSQQMVEGVRYRISDGEVQFDTETRFTFSDSPVPVDSLEMNIAVDTLGNMGVVWRENESSINAAVWAQRGIRYSDGSWISPVESMGELDDDSTMITGVHVNEGGGSGTIEPFVRTGTTDSVDEQWSQWIPVSEAAALRQATKGIASYYQIQMRMYRDAVDTIFSPSVRQAKISWDVKPVISGIDSLMVNGRSVPGFAFGHTQTVFSRMDTLDLFFSLTDKDAGDRLSGTVTWSPDQTFSLTCTDTCHGHVRLLPQTVSDSTYTVTVNTSDDDGWQATPRLFKVKTVNDIPDIQMKAILDTGSVHDTVEVLSTMPLVYLQETDSLKVLYSLSDYNDPSTTADLTVGGERIHSTEIDTEGDRIIRAETLGNATDTLFVSAQDPDTVTLKAIRVRVNRPPAIHGLQKDSILFGNGDEMLIVPGRATLCSVSVTDPNEKHWDELSFRFTTETFDTLVDGRTLSFVPTRQDSILTVTVTDQWSRVDSMNVSLVYPWYSKDNQENRQLVRAREMLASEISHIIGNGEIDTIVIPLVNSGSAPLQITGMSFNGAETNWFNLALGAGDDYVRYQRLPGDVSFQTITIEPCDTVEIQAYLNAQRLEGDGIVRDTLILSTSDPVHPYDTLAVRLEHNDLPVMHSLSFEYDPSLPYWEVLGKKTASGGYRFPPHARLSMRFSEPIDSVSAFTAIGVYSFRDSLQTGRAELIPLDHSWNESGTVLSLAPDYSRGSVWAGGKIPPRGAFLPTDSIALVVSSDLVDQATTPSGPNALDINRDFIRDVNSDTLIPLVVDSAQFELVEVSPGAGETNVFPTDSIVLTFSSPIYHGTVDTAGENNSTLRIMTAYMSRIEPRRQIVFDTVYIQGNRAVFVPQKRFFFADSVYCYYQGVSVRDTLGYPVDVDTDGIPAHFIDSSSVEDDFVWNFFVADNPSRQPYPAPKQEKVSIETHITLNFGQPLYPGTIDTSRSNNRTLLVTSKFSKGEQLSFDSIRVEENAAVFTLSQRLSYLDSVHCRFNGLLTSDTVSFSVDPGQDRYVTTQSDMEWYFFTEPVRILSVSPDSASRSASARNPISLEFSGPVSPQLFDTLLDQNANRSFKFYSTYSAGNSLPVRDIRFSVDSHTVTIIPELSFYSHDSIYCQFYGFSDEFHYGSRSTFLPGDTGGVRNSYSWYFKTGNTGFYTYPNPYKPGADRRHRELGGIWFKNLHTLKKAITSVNIRVFNINSHPVFDAHKAGYTIEFEAGSSTHKPEWFWDVKNTRGSPLASGIYLYAIYAPNGEVLLKGKILIVR